MKHIIVVIAVILATAAVGRSQINNAKTETVTVYGNCGMCETAIETAAAQKRLSKAEWNKDTRLATITYDSKRTTLDAVLKKIALAGYDNQDFLAPDEAYNKLPACCKYERVRKKTAVVTQPIHKPSTTVPHQHGHTQNGATAAAADTSQLKAVYNNYFALKDALVKTDGKSASQKANELLAAVNAVRMEKLPMNVHTVWMNILSKLKEDAGHISGTSDIAHQREHFIRLSATMYELIKEAKPGGTVYYQFCPMANDGKGANWLSRESSIKNPYYGAEMLTCGKTVETISH